MIEVGIIVILIATTSILYGWTLRQDREIERLERELKWLRKVVNDR